MKKYMVLATLVMIIDRVLKSSMMGTWGCIFPQQPGTFNLCLVYTKHLNWLEGVSLGYIFLRVIFYFGMMAAISYYLKPQTKLHMLPFALALYGAMSNVADYMMYNYVVNVISITTPPHSWINFNIADVTLLLGYAFYLLIALVSIDWRILSLKELLHEINLLYRMP